MADNLDALAGKIVELADKLQGPGAAAAIESMRVDAYSAMAGGGIALVVAGLSFYAARKLWQMKDSRGDDAGSKVVGGILFAVFGFALLIGLWAFVDPWVWTTIQHPELRLAHKLLGG